MPLLPLELLLPWLLQLLLQRCSCSCSRSSCCSCCCCRRDGIFETQESGRSWITQVGST